MKSNYLLLIAKISQSFFEICKLAKKCHCQRLLVPFIWPWRCKPYLDGFYQATLHLKPKRCIVARARIDGFFTSLSNFSNFSGISNPKPLSNLSMRTCFSETSNPPLQHLKTNINRGLFHFQVLLYNVHNINRVWNNMANMWSSRRHCHACTIYYYIYPSFLCIFEIFETCFWFSFQFWHAFLGCLVGSHARIFRI